MKQQQLLELYDTYSNNVFRLAMSFLGNTADSEDIVQNVYTKLIEKSPHISKGKIISAHDDGKYVQESSKIRSEPSKQQLRGTEQRLYRQRIQY